MRTRSDIPEEIDDDQMQITEEELHEGKARTPNSSPIKDRGFEKVGNTDGRSTFAPMSITDVQNEGILYAGGINILNKNAKKRAKKGNSPSTAPVNKFETCLGDTILLDSPSPVNEVDASTFGSISKRIKESLNMISNSQTLNSIILSPIEEEMKEIESPPDRCVNLFVPTKKSNFTAIMKSSSQEKSGKMISDMVLCAGGISDLNIKKSRLNSPSTAPASRVKQRKGDTIHCDLIPPSAEFEESASSAEEPPSMSVMGESLVEESKLLKELEILKRIGLKMSTEINIPKVANLPGSPIAQKPAVKEDGTMEEKKKILILDLDNTLVQTKLQQNRRFLMGAQGLMATEFRGPIFYTKNKEYSFFLRPFAIDFLLKMKKLYFMVVFTAAETRYATRVLEKIESMAGEKLFSFFYSRSHLGRLENGFPVKRLIADVEEGQMVVVDDSFMYWFHCPRNFIPVKPFTGEMKDTVLVTLGAYLKEAAQAEDVRVINDQNLQIIQRMTEMFSEPRVEKE